MGIIDVEKGQTAARPDSSSNSCCWADARSTSCVSISRAANFCNFSLILFCSQTTLKMPEDIQHRISHVIGTSLEAKIAPAATIINNKLEILSAAQAHSATTAQNLKDVQTTTIEAIHTRGSESDRATTRLEDKLGRITASQETSAELTAEVCSKLENISIAHSTSADLVTQNVRQVGQDTEKMMHIQTFERRAQSSSLQVLIRELVYVVSLSQCIFTNNIRMLLAPYLIAFHKSTIQELLLYGDHFLFEDAIERIKRLPCNQFQH
jgi:hypothetical protein